MDPPESGFAVFGILTIPWSKQHICTNFLYACMQIFCVIGLIMDHRIQTLCVIGH